MTSSFSISPSTPRVSPQALAQFSGKQDRHTAPLEGPYSGGKNALEFGSKALTPAPRQHGKLNLLG